MRKSKFGESQIVEMLKDAESGVPVADLLRKHGVLTIIDEGNREGLEIAIGVSLPSRRVVRILNELVALQAISGPRRQRPRVHRAALRRLVCRARCGHALHPAGK